MSIAEFEFVAKELHGYGSSNCNPLAVTAPGGGPFLLANMTEFGKTPIIKRERFEELGYHCVIYPVSTLRCAMGAVNACLSAIKNEGSVEPVLERCVSPEPNRCLLPCLLGCVGSRRAGLSCRRFGVTLVCVFPFCSMLTRKELYEHLNYTPGKEYAYPDGNSEGSTY